MVGLELKFKAPETYEKESLNRLEVFYAKEGGETEKW